MKYGTGKFVYGKESGTVYIEKTFKKQSSYALQREDFPGRGFSWGGGGGCSSEKTGLGKLLGKCVKQIRGSDKASFKYISAGRIRKTNEIWHGKICIRERIRTSIYGKNIQKA